MQKYCWGDRERECGPFCKAYENGACGLIENTGAISAALEEIAAVAARIKVGLGKLERQKEGRTWQK